jgi:Flp pilus assembly protein TadD
LIFTGCTAALLVLATSLAGGATISESNYFNLGNKLRDQGRIDEAIIQFRKAIALSPGDIVAHNNLALLLERRFESRGEAVTEWETVRQLSKAISDDARIERAERHLKSLRQSQGDIDLATPPDSSR